MSWKNLQSFRISLVVLVVGFLLTACDWKPDINFPDMSEHFYNAYHGYYGKVVNNETQKPISGAKILCNTQLYESNSEGYYEITNLNDEFELTIKVIKEGYEEYIQTVSIKGDEAQELNISLIPIENSL